MAASRHPFLWIVRNRSSPLPAGTMWPRRTGEWTLPTVVRRKAAARLKPRYRSSAFAFGRVGQARASVIVSKLWRVGQQFGLWQAAGQVAEDVAHGVARSAHARRAEPDVRIDTDAIQGPHRLILRQVTAAGCNGVSRRPNVSAEPRRSRRRWPRRLQRPVGPLVEVRLGFTPLRNPVAIEQQVLDPVCMEEVV